jgi:membrane protein required for colicin V production
MMRGFTREVLAIGSWLVAAVVAYLFHPAGLPYIKPYISNDTAALAVSVGAIFLVTLVIVSLITVKISDFVLDSRIGAIDRTLGFLFGAARGLLICVIGYIFFVQLVGDRAMPDWAKSARSRPVLDQVGEKLIAALPQDFEKYVQELMKKAKIGNDAPAAPGAPGVAPPAPAPAPGQPPRQP